jgi:hypothetical protein
MPAPRRTFALTMAVLLAAPAMGAPQAASAQGPPRVGDVLTLPESVWTNINRFVFLVAFDVYGSGITQVPYEHHLSKLDSYKELVLACRQWGLETFPALQKIAADLAKDDIGGMLVAMKNASEGIAAIAAGRGNPGQLASHRSVFETQSAALEKRFAALSALSDTATGQMDRLRKASKATIYEYKLRKLPPTEFVEVGANPDAVLAALNAENGSWTWLLSDVKELRRRVGQAQSTAGAEAIYAQIGLDTWKDIARAAQGFMTDIPRQQRFLSGDNYYDNCGPVVEGRQYALSNLFGGLRVLSLDGMGFTPGPKLRLWNITSGMGGPASGKWQFRKIYKGWWRITNAIYGDAKALDGGKEWVGVVPIGNFSGQYWRFLPAGNQGGCRLINSFLGDLSSLTTMITGRERGNNSPIFEVNLADTTGGQNQQWKLRELTAGGF